jgi:hypothetical protein
MHPDRHTDAILPIHIKATLDDVDDLAVVGYGYSSSGIHGTDDIILIDHSTCHAHNTTAVV